MAFNSIVYKGNDKSIPIGIAPGYFISDVYTTDQQPTIRLK